MTRYDLKIGTELELKREINQYGRYMKIGEKAIVENVDFENNMVELNIVGKGKMFGTIRETLEYFKLSKKEDAKKCKVIDPDVKTIVHDGKTTVVILKDDSVGIAHCLPEDTFDESVGEEVAYIKAKINSLQNKLKQY